MMNTKSLKNHWPRLVLAVGGAGLCVLVLAQPGGEACASTGDRDEIANHASGYGDG